MMLISILLLGGCTTAPPKAQADIDMDHDIGWPAAPQVARIHYLYAFKNPIEIGYKLPFRDRFQDLVGGATNHNMTRPYAIAVSQKIIAVADPGQGSVHIFNTKKKTYSSINSVNKKPLASPIGIALGNENIFIADSVLKQVFVLDKNHKHVATYGDFMRPTSLAYDDANEKLYVADTLAHKVFAINRNGQVDLVIGERGHGDGQFNFPSHIAITNDLLYVNDTMNFQIQIFDLNGIYISKLGIHGDSPGYFSTPKGIAINSNGYVFVAEALANRIQIFNQAGDFLLDFGFSGKQVAAFQMPTGLAIHGNKIYVADSGNRRIQVFEYQGEN